MIVASGSIQVQGIDYIETFSLVVKLKSIKLLLALATQHNLEIHQLGIKTIFLNGFLKEDIHMTILEGLPPTRTNKICELHKSLYSLKQSSKAWY